METFINTTLFIHVITASVALLCGTISSVTRKGSNIHIQSGKIFYYSMFTCILAAFIISVAPEHENPFLFSIGIFSLYFLWGGKRSIQYKNKNLNLRADKYVSYFMILTCNSMIILPFLLGGGPNVVLLIFGLIGLGLAFSDLVSYKNLKTLREKYLRIHIVKMSGAFIAAISAFLVTNNIFPGLLNWFLPTVVGSLFIRYYVSKSKPKKIPRNIIVTGMFLLISISVGWSQVYTEKQTRHRFAQMTLGFDGLVSAGGETKFLSNEGDIKTIQLPNSFASRFIIGGTHFWGHADFYVAIPIYESSNETKDLNIFQSSGAETVFKFYPYKIKHNKVRPFVGTSLTSYTFKQEVIGKENGIGPQSIRNLFPLMAGITFNSNNHLLELSSSYNYTNSFDYHISPTISTEIKSAPIQFSLSYKYMFDTTIGAEKDWESGTTRTQTENLHKKGILSGFYLGAAVSSAWWLGKSSYNESLRPYVPQQTVSIMPDLTIGYYWHKPDLNLAISYRGYSRGAEVYDTKQFARRRSTVLEATKIVADYHGFCPFIGPAVGVDQLLFQESHNGEDLIEFKDRKLSYGLTFGWDIRPNRIQWFTLRTNLRYFPQLHLDIGSEGRFNFNNIEFNFIQFVFYPERIWG